MKTILKAQLSLLTAIILVFYSFPAHAAEEKLYSDTIDIASPVSVEKSLEIGSTKDLKLRIVSAKITSPESTKFSFVSDDGSENDYTYRDIFVSNGVAMTIPVVEDYVSGRIGSVQIPLEQLLILQHDYGFEIGSHTMTHKKLTTLSDEEMKYQLSESKKSLTEMGLNVKNIYFPFGDFNEKVIEEASKIYRASRTSEIGDNKTLDKTRMKTYWIDEGLTNLSQAKKIVDTAIAEKQGFVIFSYHSTTASKIHMEETVSALVKYILSQNNTQILTVDKSLDRIENIVNIGEDVKIKDGKIILRRFFARSLAVGMNTLELKFSDGSTESLKINVSKSASGSYRYANDEVDLPLSEKKDEEDTESEPEPETKTEPEPQSPPESVPQSEEEPKPVREKVIFIRLSDIRGHWAEQTIETLVSKGIINGYADSTFKCENNINIDEFIKIVVCAMGYKVEQSPSYWAQNYINKAYELGLIEEGDFDNFNNPINRFQMTKIIVLSITNEGNVKDTAAARGKLADYKNLGQYTGYVLQAVSKGIITGYPDSCFHGERYATRAEAAVIIERAIDKSKRKPLEQ